MSVRTTVRELERLQGIDAHVLGTLDPQAPQAWRSWCRNAHAVPQYGVSAFHWAPAMRDTLDRIDPDVVDVQGLWTNVSRVSRTFRTRTKHPYIVTPRGMLDPWALGFSRWKKRLAAAWFQDAHLHAAACLRATAPMEADHFRAYGLRQPIAVVPNGVDLPELVERPPRGDRRRRLLFLSRIHPKKGLAHLLRAWAALADRFPEWELVVAGPDEIGHTAEMQTLTRELGAPRVTWPGPVHGEAKSRLYRSADLFVLPTHAENFGLVVAEALAHEVPVVTTHHAPWSGLDEEGCGWWIPLELDALVATLERAMALDDAARDAMGAAGRAWMARDFAWSVIARQMVDVYRWVSGATSPPSFVVTA